jgi:hypothetical protein
MHKQSGIRIYGEAMTGKSTIPVSKTRIGLKTKKEKIYFYQNLEEIRLLEDERKVLVDKIKVIYIKNAEIYWKVKIGDIFEHKQTGHTVRIVDYDVNLYKFIGIPREKTRSGWLCDPYYIDDIFIKDYKINKNESSKSNKKVSDKS